MLINPRYIAQGDCLEIMKQNVNILLKLILMRWIQY